jgi:hypothetical protein
MENEHLRDLLSNEIFEPRPLIFSPGNLGIIWSAKSACTKVVAWYFKLNNLLHAANFYDDWPHKYREEVLYRSDVYRRWLAAAGLEGIRWVQFGRDPVKRALSSYRHNLRYGYADPLIGGAIGRRIERDTGYSLNEFLSYLEQQDLFGKCDIHVKSQVHLLTQYAEVINIDRVDMHTFMNKIESELGFPITDFGHHPKFRSIDDSHNARTSSFRQIDPDRRLTRIEAGGLWPLTVDTVPKETLSRIKTIYSKDIDVFG